MPLPVPNVGTDPDPLACARTPRHVSTPATRDARARQRRPPLWATLLPTAALLAACGGGSGTTADPFGAYNTQGGAARAGNYSTTASAPASDVVPVEYHGLVGGLLGPPLELPLGRMAIIARCNTMTTLALVQRDSMLWHFRFAPNEHPMPGIAADSSGTLYVITTRGHLRAFSPEGRQLWERATQPDTPGAIVVPSALLALGDGIVFGNSLGRVMRYDHTGREVWSLARGASTSGTPAADPAIGIALIVSNNSYDIADTLLVLDPATGRQRWARALTTGRATRGPAIVGSHIVLGTVLRDEDDHRLPRLTTFNAQGSAAWTAPLPLLPQGIACDAEANVYVSCAGAGAEQIGGAVASFDANGKRRWLVTLQSGVPAAPSVGKDWIYFISRRDGRTGLFTYRHDGTYYDFISIDIVPDVHAQTMISSAGELTLAALDVPALLRGK